MDNLLTKIRNNTKCHNNYYNNNHNCVCCINNCILYYNTYKQLIPMDIFNEIDFASSCLKKIDIHLETVFVNQIKYCLNDNNTFLDIINIMIDMQLIKNIYSKTIINTIFNDINYINIFIENIFNYDKMLCDKIISYYDPFRTISNVKCMINNILAIIENPKIDTIEHNAKNILYSWCLYSINYIKNYNSYYQERPSYHSTKTFDKTYDIRLTKFKNDLLNSKNFNPDNNVMVYSFLYDSYEDTMKICKSTNVNINKDTLNNFIIKLSHNMLLESYSPINLEKIINFLHENGSDPHSIKYEQINLDLSYNHRYNQKNNKNWIQCVNIIFNFLNENSVQINLDTFKKLINYRIVLKNPQKSGIDINEPILKTYFYSINYNPYKIKFDSSIELLREQSSKSGNLTKIKTLCKEIKPDITCLQNACCHKNNIHTVRYFIDVHKLKVDITSLMNCMSNVGNTSTKYIINGFKKDTEELKKIELENVDLEKADGTNIIHIMDSVNKIENKNDTIYSEKPKKKVKPAKNIDKVEIKVELKIDPVEEKVVDKPEDKPKKVVRRVVKKKADDKANDKVDDKADANTDSDTDNKSITSDRSILKTLKEIKKITEKNENKTKKKNDKNIEIKVINKHTQNNNINLDEYIIPNEYDFRKEYQLTELGKKIIDVEKISHINLRKNLLIYLKDNKMLKLDNMSIDNIKFNIKNIDKFISAQLLTIK